MAAQRELASRRQYATGNDGSQYVSRELVTTSWEADAVTQRF
jgi:hypothetical protein